MANIDNVQLPDGSSYNIVDNTSGFATQNYVDSAVSSVTKTTIGLGNVDNTSDLNKPISTATQTALDTLDEGKADKTDIATVESGTTASRAYSVGELVYVSGTLYRVKTAIASGATFTVGTNVEVTNVSSAVTTEINSVNAFMPIFGTTKGKGAIVDALNVDINNVDGSENKVGYVYSGYSNSIPQSLAMGTREVYYYNSSSIYIKITGVDKNNMFSEWGNYYNGSTWTGWRKIGGGDIVLRTVDKISSLSGTYAITGGNIKEFSNLNFQILAGSGHAVASILIPTDLFVAGRVYRAIYTDGVNLAYADVSRASDTVMSVVVNQAFVDAQFGVALIGVS